MIACYLINSKVTLFSRDGKWRKPKEHACQMKRFYRQTSQQHLLWKLEKLQQLTECIALDKRDRHQFLHSKNIQHGPLEP